MIQEIIKPINHYKWVILNDRINHLTSNHIPHCPGSSVHHERSIRTIHSNGQLGQFVRTVGLNPVFGPKCGLLRIKLSAVLNLFDMKRMKLSTPGPNPSSGCNNCVSNQIGHSHEWWKNCPIWFLNSCKLFWDFSGKMNSFKVEKMLKVIKKIQIRFIFTLATQPFWKINRTRVSNIPMQIKSTITLSIIL